MCSSDVAGGGDGRIVFGMRMRGSRERGRARLRIDLGEHRRVTFEHEADWTDDAGSGSKSPVLSVSVGGDTDNNDETASRTTTTTSR